VSGRARGKRKVEPVKGLTATVVAGLGLAVVCGAAPGARADTQAEEVEKGRAFVQANCARCHAIGLDDASPHAKAPPFRIVVERYPSENLAEALAEGIVSGHPDMPVFVLKPEEIEAFLAYLDSLGPTAPAQK
jgi:cytochrome c